MHPEDQPPVASPATHARRIAWACVAMGLFGAASFAYSVSVSTNRFSHLEVFAFFAIVLTTLQVRPLRLSHEGDAESLQLEEIFFVPMALLLSRTETLIALGVAVAFSHVWFRRGFLKGAFNVGQLVTSAAIGLEITHAVGVSAGQGLDPVRLIAALLGGVVFTVASAVAVSSVIALAQQASLREVLLDGWSARITTWAGSLSLGALVAAAATAHLWALPVVIVPVLVLQVAYARSLAQWRERQRIAALYEPAASL